MIINVDIDINLIQQIRVIHSLAEKNEVYVRPEEYHKIKPIDDNFQINLHKGFHDNGIMLSSILEINHSKPETKINGKIKPLIFPIGLINMCESLNEEKNNDIYFRGLLTKNRENAILRLKESTTLNVVIESSNRGRKFPIKSLDIEYFKKLSSYNFNYCPNGDYMWSYRFFESVMCKSIPIVEDDYPTIREFKYLTLNNDLNNLTWNNEWVEHNSKILKEKFTL